MNDKFPTEWKFLCVEYDRNEQIIKRYCERIASVNGDEATIEVGWFQMNNDRKVISDIHIERRYVKRIGGLIKTLPLLLPIMLLIFQLLTILQTQYENSISLSLYGAIFSPNFS